MGLGLISFSESLERLRPDLLVILGDRFEGLAAASAAMVCRIPIAHLHGGEATHGLIDEPIRHSITKMSHLHFTSTEKYKRRVMQLGESPERVFNVGAIGIENIKTLPLYSREELAEKIGFDLGARNILVTFHPVTLENNTAGEQFQNLLDAIDSFADLKVVFTKANADTEGRIVNKMIDKYVSKKRGKAFAFVSMGQLKYLSTMKHVDAVVGNSSSGIIEAPSFRIPTVNIGDRQKGRVRAWSVIDCEPERKAIIETLKKAFSLEFKETLKNIRNPYEKENTSKIIKEIIKSFNLKGILKKKFFDLVNRRTS